jgi:KipI family sensor histidine kinase inhibitor
MGDRALLIEVGDRISSGINSRVRELFISLDREKVKGIKDIIPSYRSILVVYDPLEIPLTTLQSTMNGIYEKADGCQMPDPKTLEIPVVYGGEYGPDLYWVAEYHQITSKEVVRFHSETLYQVYMIGFTPGYPYMGELPEAIATPRRDTPRTAVPKGSVAIALRQTGIYPTESPGGWQIIGRTPFSLFNPYASPPVPLEMGDRVKFFPIKEKDFSHWEA